MRAGRVGAGAWGLGVAFNSLFEMQSVVRQHNGAVIYIDFQFSI